MTRKLTLTSILVALNIILLLGLDGDFFMGPAPAFIVSSLIGALLSWFILLRLEKRNVLTRVMDRN